MKSKIYILFFVVITFVTAVNGQSILNTRIDIDVKDATVEQALKEIEKSVGFYFAYNTAYIDAERTVTMKRTNEPVKGILDDLFAKRFKYLPVGDHVVLAPRPKRADKKEILLSGYITDPESNPLDSVIVYVVDEEIVTLTRTDGSYSINLKPAKESICVSFSHPSFEDTLLHIRPDDQIINIRLYRKTPPRDNSPLPYITAKEFDALQMDSVCQDLALVKLFVPDEAVYVANQLNTGMSIPFQVSLIPGVSSNSLSSGLHNNFFSLNILAGYSGGVKGVEVGSLVNVIQKNMYGIQAAGLSNIVNGEVIGFQVSGLFNYNFGRVYGLQVAGLSNVTRGHVTGAQIGGLFNFSKGKVSGAQAAGFVNVSGGIIEGAQLAGFANVNTDDSYGAQVAGVVNYSSNVAGAQFASIFNQAENIKGVQICGLVNNCNDTLAGVQISSLVNRAHILSGLQLGVINIVDSIAGGTPVGLFNWVKNGYKAIEISSGEFYPLEIYLKSGGKHFYSLVNVGIRNHDLGVGYGLGLVESLFPKVDLNVEVLSTSMLSMEKPENMGQTYKGRLGVGFTVFKHFGITTGVSVTHFFPEYSSPLPHNGSPFLLNSNDFLNNAIESGTRATWIGWFLGIRI